ncbi:hypothetical protein BJ741DRAFT_654170 [Chytriomyces cf. hyalinus JEL632]|nr:hypothetical protein BJ741DRAFT_654170 [Chytriomyces cf. hyalinus JEL632]
MPSRRLASNARRLVLTATPLKVALRGTVPINTPSASTVKTDLYCLKLSFNCGTPSKSSFLEDLNKPTAKEPLFAHFLRDKDAAIPKEDAKTIVPESGPLQCVSPIFTTPSLGLSFKNIHTFSIHEAKSASAPAAVVESDETKASVVEMDEVDCNEHENDNYDNDGKEYKYEQRDLEDDLDHMPAYNTRQGYSSRQVIEDFNRSIIETYPDLNDAVKEWYLETGLPKVYLEPAKGWLGILELRVPGKRAKCLARYVGTRYLEWRNEQDGY